MILIPPHIAQSYLNEFPSPPCSTRATSREEKSLQSFQEQPCEKWVESSYEVDGPHYFTTLTMHILPPERWRISRVYFLRRLLVTAHARKVSAVCTNK